MPLVKGQNDERRRRRLRVEPLSLLALALVACTDPAPSAPLLTADSCEPVIIRPEKPRLVDVAFDGTVSPGPSCTSANCLNGRPGAWAYSDDAGIHAFVGNYSLDVPVRPTSRVSTVPALRGIVLGVDVLGIDRGDHLELFGLAGSLGDAPLPLLERGEAIGGLAYVDGGVVAHVKERDHHRSRHVVLVPPRATPPTADALPLGDGDEVRAWLTPGTASSPPVLTTSTGRHALPASLELSPKMQAALLGKHVLLSEGRRRYVFLDVPAAAGSVEERIVRAPDVAYVDELADGAVVAVDPQSPGAVSVLEVGARAFTPLFVGGTAHDVGGAPMPAGSEIERVVASAARGHALLISRVRLPTCTVEDRLALFDAQARTMKTLASDGTLRVHPMLAGDRFRFVEAQLGE